MLGWRATIFLFRRAVQRRFMAYMALKAFTEHRKSIPLSPASSTLINIIRQGLCEGENLEQSATKYTGEIHPHMLSEVLKQVSNAYVACFFFDWAKHEKQCVHTLSTYQCFLEALVRGDGGSFSHTKYQEMVRAGIGEDEYAFCLALVGICDTSGWSEAFEKLKSRCKQKLPLTTNMFNVVLERAPLESKETMFHAMESMVEPNVTSFKILMKCFGENLRVSKVKFFLEKVMDPDMEMYEILIQAYCRVYMDYEAASFINVMLERGYKPSFETYHLLMTCYLKNWRGACGYEVFRKIQQDGYELTGSLYQEMVQGLWDARMVDDTRKLMKEMVSKGFKPSLQVYSNLVHAFACPARVQDALEVYEEMFQAGYILSKKTFSLLVVRLSMMNRATDANKVYERMLKDGYGPDQKLFQKLVGCLCRENKVEDARRYLEQVVNEVKSVVPNVETYNCLLSSYCCFGVFYSRKLDVGSALEVFDKMVKLGRWPTIETFEIIIHGLCKGGRVMDAYELFFTIGDFELVPNAAICKTLISGLCGLNRIVEAELVFDHLIGDKRESKESRLVVSKVYKDIIEAKSKRKGVYEKCVTTFKKGLMKDTKEVREEPELTTESLGW